MNKIQLIGTVEDIHFDDFNGRMVRAEFTLVQKLAFDNKYIKVETSIHKFRCIAFGKCADLLSKMWMKNFEIAIEGKLLNKQICTKDLKIPEVEIHVTDLLFLPVRKS